MKTTVKRATQGYDDANLMAATIIASDPVRYPVGSLMSVWADMVLSQSAAPMDAECGPLFAAANRRAA